MSTTQLQRMGAIGLATVATVGLLAGCNSSKKSAAAATSASTSVAAAVPSAAASPAGAAVSAAAAASAAVAAIGSPSTVHATGGGKFCKDVATSTNNEVAKEAATGTDPTSVKALVQQEQQIETTALKEAPNAIKGDLTVLFTAVNQLYSQLAAANYDYSKLNPAALTSLDTPAVTAAEQNVDAYIKNTCGIDTGDDDTTAPSAASS